MPSMNAPFRSLLVTAALIAGLAFVYGSRIVPGLFGQEQPASDELTYITDLDFWRRTDRETAVVAHARFDLNADLQNVPLNVGEWAGEEVPQTNQEVMILLEPEQYVQRLYRNEAGQYLWLSLIGGRSSQPFHPPDICYDADGWRYNLSSTAITLDGGGEIYGLWMDAQKLFPGESVPVDHVVFYFYLFPDRNRELQDGIVLFKLTSGKYGTLEETLAIHRDFVRHLFGSVVDSGADRQL